MTHPDCFTTDSPLDESPSALGHKICALDRVIESDLDDYNFVSADQHIEVLDHLAGSVDHLTDTDARAVLTGLLHSLKIRHTATRQNAILAETQPGILAPGTRCGHRHSIANYAHGCAYATHMAYAAAAAHNGDYRTAKHHARVADRTLWPLADIDNLESLRDFIAGTNSGFEAHLRTLGTTITS